MQDYVQEKKTVAFGAGFSMFGYALSVILGLLTNVVLYRGFDQTREVNVWVVAFSFFAILEPFARLGLSDGVQRFIGVALVDRKWKRVKAAILGSLQMSALASLGMIACILAISPEIADFYSDSGFSLGLLTVCLWKVVKCLLPIAVTLAAVLALKYWNKVRPSERLDSFCNHHCWLLLTAVSLGTILWLQLHAPVPDPHPAGKPGLDEVLLCRVIRGLSLYLLPIALTTISLAVLRALNDIRHSVWIETLCQKCGWFLVVVATSFLPGDQNRVMYLVWGMVAVTLLAFLISVRCHYLAAPELRKVKPAYDRRNLLLFSLPLVFQSAILIFMKKCDIVMLGFYHGSEAIAAHYYAAGIATLVIANILVAFSSLFAPMIAKVSKKRDYAAMNELYKTVTRWMLYVTLPAAAFMLLFPEEVLAVFKCAPTPMLVCTLRIMVAAQIVSTMAGHSGTMLVMSGYSLMTLYINILAVLANVLLNWLLIPRHVMIGAALATLAAIFIRNALAVCFTRKFLKSQPFSLSTLTIAATAAVTAALSLWLFKEAYGLLPQTALTQHWAVRLAASLTLFALLYIPATLLTMHRDDRNFLRDIVLPWLRRLRS